MVYSAKREQTEKLIKETFIALYREKDIPHISVRELCEKAGINRSTFYTYYMDIYDLHEKLRDSIMQDTMDRLMDVVSGYSVFDLNVVTGDLIRCFCRDDMLPLLFAVRDKDNYIKNVLEAVHAGRMFDVDGITEEEFTRIDIALKYHFAGVMAIIDSWMDGRYCQDLDDILETIITIGNSGPVSLVRDHIFTEDR